MRFVISFLLIISMLFGCQNSSTTKCDDNLFEEDSKCVACLEDFHCNSDEYCTVNRECTKKLQPTGNCQRNEMCISGLCFENSCLIPNGESCSSNEECIDNFCLDGVCCNSSCNELCSKCSETGRCEPVEYGKDTGCDTYCLDGMCQPCPEDMVSGDSFCMDRYEAPNINGASPLVMYTYLEAQNWCNFRGKRLCYDSEWQTMCEGINHTSYPYGDIHEPGYCNDDKLWKTYNQTLLNGWPLSVSTPEISSLEELIQNAQNYSTSGKEAANHVMDIYQAEQSGSNPQCTNTFNVFDLCGNVEEWTTRSDGGTTNFHGNLKGRYWAESRTCQSNITVHGDTFRFYEIGFRCCSPIHIPGL